MLQGQVVLLVEPLEQAAGLLEQVAELVSCFLTRKVTVGGVAGALSVVLIWAANAFWMPTGKQIPAEIASAITTILTFIVSSLVPEPT